MSESKDVARTRAKAIATGALVDLMEGPLRHVVDEAGMRIPVAITAAAFQRCIVPPVGAHDQDAAGRLWGVLAVLRAYFRVHRQGQPMLFSVSIVTEGRAERQRCALKAVLGPDDVGAPCLTLMLPHEDHATKERHV